MGDWGHFLRHIFYSYATNSNIQVNVPSPFTLHPFSLPPQFPLYLDLLFHHPLGPDLAKSMAPAQRSLVTCSLCRSFFFNLLFCFLCYGLCPVWWGVFSFFVWWFVSLSFMGLSLLVWSSLILDFILCLFMVWAEFPFRILYYHVINSLYARPSFWSAFKVWVLWAC